MMSTTSERLLVKYLLDTNFILGMLKATPEVLALVGNAVAIFSASEFLS